MYQNILNNNQIELLPIIKKFSRKFYLVGGTAIALHLGHRRSVDFDLFTLNSIERTKIKSKLNEFAFRKQVIFEDVDQVHFSINHVKLTFFKFPYSIKHNLKFENYISLPDLLTLASMKAFALSRRSKWKDFVDLFFIIKYHFTIEQIGNEAKNNFGDMFSEKLFRQQLAFHKDIDYSEPIEYLVEPISEEEIKEFLIEEAVNI